MLRLSEIYLSTQGEGPNVGKPTCFVRFAGCNLRCAGWPCDTPFAIYPKEFRHSWRNASIDDTVKEVIDVTDSNAKVTICFTGGEPMLQHTDDLLGLQSKLIEAGYNRQEMFSNGTIHYPRQLLDNLAVIMDWKLLGSNEDPYNEVRLQNLKQLGARDSVKFVCKHEVDYEEAVYLWKQNIYKKSYVQVYYGVVWGGKLEAKDLVAWVLRDKLPWKLNYQVHNVIWPAHERSR